MLDVNKLIATRLRTENALREAKHTPSGKLSASMLGSPIQWQVLKYLGVEQRPVDDYTLAKFKRGNHVEDFIVETVKLSDPKLKQQVECNYKGCIGYLDILTGDEYPIEVKSTTNKAFSWIKKDGAKKAHILQGCYYALALKKDRFSVLYVASDDYRTFRFDFLTRQYQNEVDKAISLFNKVVERKEIPVFEALEKWQADEKYNPYPEWINLSKDTLEEKAKTLYNSKLKE